MTSECDKCHNHTLECECQKHIPGLNDKFYHQGKFFEKEEEFWADAQEFTKRQTSAQDFSDLFDSLKKDIWINITFRHTKLTNSEVGALIEEMFGLAIERLWRFDE